MKQKPHRRFCNLYQKYKKLPFRSQVAYYIYSIFIFLLHLIFWAALGKGHETKISQKVLQTYTISTKSYHLDLRLQIKFTAFSYICYTLFSVGCFADFVKNCHCQCIFDIVKVIVCKTNFPNTDFIHHY